MGGGETFLNIGPPPPYPLPSQDFRPYRIPPPGVPVRGRTKASSWTCGARERINRRTRHSPNVPGKAARHASPKLPRFLGQTANHIRGIAVLPTIGGRKRVRRTAFDNARYDLPACGRKCVRPIARTASRDVPHMKTAAHPPKRAFNDNKAPLWRREASRTTNSPRTGIRYSRKSLEEEEMGFGEGGEKPFFRRRFKKQTPTKLL